jgi:hypothetical protein
MGASATLDPQNPRVEPGSVTVVQVRIRNTGGVVDQFTFSVVGGAAGWATFDPPTLSLFPGAEGTVVLRLAPPRSHDVAAGEVPFGVKVESKEDPKGSVVEEGVLEVGAFADVFAELVPRTARGRGSARYDLALDNRGNTRINAAIAAADANEMLSFDLRPPGLVAEPNTAVFAKVEARARKRFLRGAPKTHPFQIAVQTEDGGPLPVDGTMLQEAVIPGWLPKALAGLLALLLLMFAIAALVSKKNAKNEAQKAVGPVKAQTAALTGQQAAQADAITDLQKKIDPNASPLPPPTPIPSPVATAMRLTAKPPEVAAGKDGADSLTIEAGKRLHVTDLILENPQGDSGTLKILRGSTPLLELRLDNFRDFDYHFVTPLMIEGGDKLTLQVHCDAPGKPAATCRPGVLIAGSLETTGP